MCNTAFSASFPFCANSSAARFSALQSNSDVFRSLANQTTSNAGQPPPPPSAKPQPPSGTIPSYTPIDPNVSTDLACRPKLSTTALKSTQVVYTKIGDRQEAIAGPMGALGWIRPVTYLKSTGITSSFLSECTRWSPKSRQRTCKTLPDPSSIPRTPSALSLQSETEPTAS